jgi:hypothetical protein
MGKRSASSSRAPTDGLLTALGNDRISSRIERQA